MKARELDKRTATPRQRTRGGTRAPTTSQATLPGLDRGHAVSTFFDAGRFQEVSGQRQRELEGQRSSRRTTHVQPNLWGEVREVQHATPAGEVAGSEESAALHNASVAAGYTLAALIREHAPSAVNLLREHPQALEVLLTGRTAAPIGRLSRLEASQLIHLAERLEAERGANLAVVPAPSGEHWLIDQAAFSRALQGMNDRLENLAPGETWTFARLALASPKGHPLRRALLSAQPDPQNDAARAHTQSVLTGERPTYQRCAGSIDQVAVVTFNRPRELKETVTTYLENLARHGRDQVELVVYDDSSGSAAAANEAFVNGLRQGGARIRYVGVEEKKRLRAILANNLDGVLDAAPREQAARLDHLLGFEDAKGIWQGSPGRQRAWISLLSSGSRVMVVDDDTKPGTLDVSLEGRRFEADRAAERLPLLGTLADRQLAQVIGKAVRDTALSSDPHAEALSATPLAPLLTGDDHGQDAASLLFLALQADPSSAAVAAVQQRVLIGLRHHDQRTSFSALGRIDDFEILGQQTFQHRDLIAAAEATRDGYSSFAYTGHEDAAAETPITNFGFASRRWKDALKGDIGLTDLHEAQRSHDPQFRGSTYVTQRSLDGVAIGPTTRDEDLMLSLTLDLTSGGRQLAETLKGLFHHHLRGRRWTNQAIQLRAQSDSAYIGGVFLELQKAYQDKLGDRPFDAEAFASFARRYLEDPAVWTDLESTREEGEETYQELVSVLDGVEKTVATLEACDDQAPEVAAALHEWTWAGVPALRHQFDLTATLQLAEALEKPDPGDLRALADARFDWKLRKHFKAELAALVPDPGALSASERSALARQVRADLATHVEHAAAEMGQSTDTVWRQLREGWTDIAALAEHVKQVVTDESAPEDTKRELAELLTDQLSRRGAQMSRAELISELREYVRDGRKLAGQLEELYLVGPLATPDAEQRFFAAQKKRVHDEVLNTCESLPYFYALQRKLYLAHPAP